MSHKSMTCLLENDLPLMAKFTRLDACVAQKYCHKPFKRSTLNSDIRSFTLIQCNWTNHVTVIVLSEQTDQTTSQEQQQIGPTQLNRIKQLDVYFWIKFTHQVTVPCSNRAPKLSSSRKFICLIFVWKRKNTIRGSIKLDNRFRPSVA